MKHISGQTYTLKHRNAYLYIQRKAHKLPGQHLVRKKFHNAEAPIGCQSPTKTINNLRIVSGSVYDRQSHLNINHSLSAWWPSKLVLLNINNSYAWMRSSLLVHNCIALVLLSNAHTSPSHAANTVKREWSASKLREALAKSSNVNQSYLWAVNPAKWDDRVDLATSKYLWKMSSMGFLSHT